MSKTVTVVPVAGDPIVYTSSDQNVAQALWMAASSAWKSGAGGVLQLPGGRYVNWSHVVSFTVS